MKHNKKAWLELDFDVLQQKTTGKKKKGMIFFSRDVFECLVGVALLVGDGSLLLHGGEDGNEDGLASLEGGLDLVADFAFGELNVVLGLTRGEEERKETIIANIEELVLGAADVGDHHVVGRGAHIFVLAAVEDVNADEVNLGVTVLASLRG